MIELLELILEPIDLLSSVVVDIFVFIIISQLCKKKFDYAVLISLSIGVFVLSLFGSTFLFNTFGLTIIEIIILCLYFHVVKGEPIILILGSSLVFGLFDLFVSVLFLFLMTLPSVANFLLYLYVLNIIFNFLELYLVYRYKNNIIAVLNNKNSRIVTGLALGTVK